MYLTYGNNALTVNFTGLYKIKGSYHHINEGIFSMISFIIKQYNILHLPHMFILINLFQTRLRLVKLFLLSSKR